ncbi:MAG: mannonate dehydratase [Oscillospiraceae bacterium]|jgi:mannonate dehydratase|nr:mannonate dehydratase [Oscillospiraceae bacterium]
MKMSFRWYGERDPISLEKISQIPGMHGIVSAVYEVPVGQEWPEERIDALKSQAAAHGLAFEVVESVPVHERIKMGAPDADALIGVFAENLRRLAKAGVKVVCYNFMPVFDWLRSELARTLPDGSNALAYDEEAVLKLDPSKGDLSLPGWDESYTKEELRALLDQYKNINDEKLWENMERFLKKVIPVCDEAGIKLAIHPDDPPWSLFGLPRIITGANSYERLFSIEPSDSNGVTLCTGSLGADPANDLPAIIRKYARKIHFVHARNILITGGRQFQESAHPTECGSLDMYAIIKALVESGFDGYIRPDHGRMIWGETGKPGYGLYDRALGACYLSGLWEGISKTIL